jgi:hypothetical protein
MNVAAFNRTTKNSIPTPLGDVLASTRQVTLKRSRAAVDRDTWRRAVGRRIADRTDVGSLRAGELTVYVASAAWAQELSLLTREITSVLEVTGIRVERCRFRVRPDLGRPRSQVPAKTSKPRQPLPPDLEERLSRIDDEELRSAIAEAASLALTRLAAAERAPKRPLPAPARARPPNGEPRSVRAPPDAEGENARTGRRIPEPTAARRGTRGGRSG